MASWVKSLGPKALLLVAACLVLAGCSGDPGAGPVEVTWDRDVCERCSMVVSDREHAAQVRYIDPATARSRVALFDDLGCAVLWLERPDGRLDWRGDPSVEIWVTDYRDGSWIDARIAHYVRGRITPMQYGLGARIDPVDGALDFDAALAHIRHVEQTFNIHGGALDHAMPGHLPPTE
jgi:nitrous oxide reductase accessory protein NosL